MAAGCDLDCGGVYASNMAGVPLEMFLLVVAEAAMVQ
jgi:hypothetical protein